MTDFVLFARGDAVVTLTLNRPEERNAQTKSRGAISCATP